jgi:hypothetical protein
MCKKLKRLAMAKGDGPHPYLNDKKGLHFSCGKIARKMRFTIMYQKGKALSVLWAKSHMFVSH